MIVRTREWWDERRLDDAPDRRRGGGPLVRALLERDGRPVGYALYRLVQEGSTPADWKKTVRVLEAFGIDSAATRDIWRFLLEIDWVDRIAAHSLPLDHPLPLLVDRVNELDLTVWDGLWVRLVDVPTALAARALRGRARHDRRRRRPALADNVGTWTVDDGSVPRRGGGPMCGSPSTPSVRSTSAGSRSPRLVAAGLAEEGARGGAARADAVFRTAPGPWPAEMF